MKAREVGFLTKCDRGKLDDQATDFLWFLARRQKFPNGLLVEYLGGNNRFARRLEPFCEYI